MKTILLFIGILLGCSMTGIGQNYMGMSQTKILKNFGKPDSIGSNYFVYTDQEEDGENIYYFDGSGNCNSFEIVRNVSHLHGYQKILNREFTKTCNNRYVKKTKKMNYLAELTLGEGSFQIKILDCGNLIASAGDILVDGTQLECRCALNEEVKMVSDLNK